MKTTVDTQKTRRRCEDALRKSGIGKIVEVANLLGVEVVSLSEPKTDIPEYEIFLADVWECLQEELKSTRSLISKHDMGQRAQRLEAIMDKITEFLPRRFELYSINHPFMGNLYLTRSGAQKACEEASVKGDKVYVKKRVTIVHMRRISKEILAQDSFGSYRDDLPEEQAQAAYYQTILSS